MPTKIVLFGGKMMGRWAAVCLQIFLQTKMAAIHVSSFINIVKCFPLRVGIFESEIKSLLPSEAMM